MNSLYIPFLNESIKLSYSHMSLIEKISSDISIGK